MYLHDKKIKQDECLICFENVNKKISLFHFFNKVPICISCLNKFKIIDHTISFHQYPLRILYDYNDFFQTLLYQYKGLYDIALKDVFLCLYLKQMRSHYKDYIIVVAPSSSLQEQVRGFSHMRMIASTIHNHIFNGLYKKEEYKQSDLSYDQRKKVKNKIGIRNKERLKGKKVLILDDVMTSSSTMETCLNLVKTGYPLTIEMLVLASSYW